METGYKRVFIDTAPFIYIIERDPNNPDYHERVIKFLMQLYDADVRLFTSVITVEEYMVFPYRNNRMDYIKSFERLIQTLNVDVIRIDDEIAREAARIRAEYRAFKGMDALQLAAATIMKCDLFLTNDRQLRQFNRIKCMTIDDIQ